VLVYKANPNMLVVDTLNILILRTVLVNRPLSNYGKKYLLSFPKCPIYVQKKQIYAYAVTENISYFVARSKFVQLLFS